MAAVASGRRSRLKARCACQKYTMGQKYHAAPPAMTNKHNPQTRQVMGRRRIRKHRFRPGKKSKFICEANIGVLVDVILCPGTKWPGVSGPWGDWAAPAEPEATAGGPWETAGSPGKTQPPRPNDQRHWVIFPLLPGSCFGVRSVADIPCVFPIQSVPLSLDLVAG